MFVMLPVYVLCLSCCLSVLPMFCVCHAVCLSMFCVCHAVCLSVYKCLSMFYNCHSICLLMSVCAACLPCLCFVSVMLSINQCQSFSHSNSIMLCVSQSMLNVCHAINLFKYPTSCQFHFSSEATL